jgi:hypothetical protein
VRWMLKINLKPLVKVSRLPAVNSGRTQEAERSHLCDYLYWSTHNKMEAVSASTCVAQNALAVQNKLPHASTCHCHAGHSNVNWHKHCLDVRGPS